MSGQLWQTALTEWNFKPSILIGLVLFCGGYLLVIGPYRRRYHWGPVVPPAQVLRFFLSALVIAFALVSPLDYLSDEYLFSAHMAQHMLLIVVFPLLFWAGIPDWLPEVGARLPWLRKMMGSARLLPLAFLIYNADVLVWHIPGLYQATLDNESLHVIEHLSFILSGLVGWWPVVGRFPKSLAGPSLPARMAYVFVMMFPTTALAALLTLAHNPLIPFYTHAPRITGLTPLADQQLSGLLMWFPGNLVIVILFSVLFFKWFRSSSEEDHDPENQYQPR